MNAVFDPKTNELKISLSINPKSTQLSGSKKTYIAASERTKLDASGEEITVQVNAYRYVDGKKSKKK